ncbi:hypothetical protein [Pseudomonas sp.]|uniref:hypothetical protein n=1 Tax=Pseudomonas sp. TaxID=306 RepID=UPI003C740894
MGKRTFIGMIEAGERLIQLAIEANRKFRAAKAAAAPAEEVDRLRLLADSLYNAVVDFQLIKAGQSPETIQ